MRLRRKRCELVHWPKVRVFFQADRPGLRRVEHDALRRHELEVLEAVPLRIDNRVDDHIPLIEVPADDRPDLRCKALRIPPFRVEAVLDVHAVNEGPVSSMRYSKQRTELESVDFPPEVFVTAVQRQVQPALKPVGDAVRPLSDTVPGFVGCDGTRKGWLLEATRGVVVVPGQIEDADGGKVSGIDLNFIGLCERDSWRTHPQRNHDRRQKMEFQWMIPLKNGGDC